MRVVVFETEPHEAAIFEGLKGRHELSLLAEPLRATNVAEHADAEAVSTFLYSTLDRAVTDTTLANIAAFGEGQPQNLVAGPPPVAGRFA